MLKRAECPHCGGRLPLDCGFFQFKLAPRTLTCGNCSQRLAAPFAYRSNWLGFQFFRGSFLAFPLMGLAMALLSSERSPGFAAFLTIFGVMVGMLVGSVTGALLAPLVQLVIDMLHGMKQLESNALDES